VTFTPSVASARSATITLNSNGTGSPQAISASGSGTTGTTPATVTVVEYYHAGFDHYFITSVPTDISALDGGAFGGVWARTGYQFKAYAAPGTGTASVCRFFSTAFAPKSSHFYTPYAFECNSLKADPGWQYEDSNLVMAMPDANGNCAAGFAPVYRFYNNFLGAAPNHRYTTDTAVKAQMLAKGYTQEGPLPGLAFMCSPP
jgi:serine protease